MYDNLAKRQQTESMKLIKIEEAESILLSDQKQIEQEKQKILQEKEAAEYRINTMETNLEGNGTKRTGM